MLHSVVNAKPLSVLLLGGLLLGGCGALNIFKSDKPEEAELRAIRIVALPDSNRRSSTGLDLVFLYRVELMEMMPKKVGEWLQRKAELQGAAPQGMDLVPLQIPPSTVMDTVVLPKRYKDAIQVLVYANYLAKGGQHSLDITRFKRVVIQLEAERITLAEQ